MVLGRKEGVGRNGSGRNEKWAKMKLVKMAKGVKSPRQVLPGRMVLK